MQTTKMWSFYVFVFVKNTSYGPILSSPYAARTSVPAM